MTLDTYYPSPAGIYTNVTVTSSTVLARDGGTVSVGSQARPGRLEVKGTAEISGNAHFGGVVVPGNLTADPTDAARKIEGAIYYNTTAKKHRVFQNGAWTDLGGGAEFALAGDTPCNAMNSGKKALGAITVIQLGDKTVKVGGASSPIGHTQLKWQTCGCHILEGDGTCTWGWN